MTIFAPFIHTHQIPRTHICEGCIVNGVKEPVSLPYNIPRCHHHEVHIERKGFGTIYVPAELVKLGDKIIW